VKNWYQAWAFECNLCRCMSDAGNVINAWAVNAAALGTDAAGAGSSSDARLAALIEVGLYKLNAV
jgi:hypothetical protein